MPIQPGTKLGAYEVHEFLGKGAIGTVYRAYHPGLARTAAVKVLQGLDPDTDTSARFQREAQAIAQMRHPHVLNVYDFGELDGDPYMVVEYMPGGSLADLARAGKHLPREEALARLDEIASALDYAHQNGIVHRDVKPANVLLDRNGRAILADFGLAKLMQSVSVKTISGVTTGTPAYMAPEQVVGGAVGPAADIYAFTTMAYEYLTGGIPFEGEGMFELLYAHVHREAPPASRRNPALNPEVDAVLARGLDKDPDARWHSCTAEMAALRAALEGRPVSLVATQRVIVQPVQDLSATPRRRRWAWILGLAALLAVILAGAAIALSPGSGSYAVKLSATAVDPGAAITITGSGFKAGDLVLIYLASGTPRLLRSQRADTAGAVVASVVIPASSTSGAHEVRLCDPANRCASAALIVIASNQPTATPSPNSTPSPTPSAVPSGSPAATPTPTPTPAVTPSRSPVPTATPPINPQFTYGPKPIRISGVVRVDGTGFASGQVFITLIQTSTPHNVGQTDTLANGSFSFQGNLPGNLKAGPAMLRVCNLPAPGTNCKDEPVNLAS